MRPPSCPFPSKGLSSDRIDKAAQEAFFRRKAVRKRPTQRENNSPGVLLERENGKKALWPGRNVKFVFPQNIQKWLEVQIITVDDLDIKRGLRIKEFSGVKKAVDENP